MLDKQVQLSDGTWHSIAIINITPKQAHRLITDLDQVLDKIPEEGSSDGPRVWPDGWVHPLLRFM